ncbi:MAG: hypothetical protein Q8M26_08650 [Pseudolabrys sp.]|nr:hypothetical protein [Pseudolabrys sp.]
MTTLLAVLSALPKILALIQFFMAKVHDAEQRGLGRKEAMAEAAEVMHFDLARADAAEIQASQAHAKDKTDAAFDNDFRRD